MPNDVQSHLGNWQTQKKLPHEKDIYVISLA